MTSVGSPQFETDEVVDRPGIDLPQPKQQSGSFPPLVALGAVISAVFLLVLAGTRDTATPPPPSTAAPTTAPPTTVDAVLESQRRAGIGYLTRPYTRESVYAAVETTDGWFGLRRGTGGFGWFTMSSVDGIAWSTDTLRPISGVPDAFRPTTRRSGSEPLQFIEGAFWGRFASERLAGASGALLTLRSEDGYVWDQPTSTPAALDRLEIGGHEIDDPAELRMTGRWVFPPDRTRGVLPIVEIGDTSGGDWVVADAAVGPSGAAILLHDETSLGFRVAVTRDHSNWNVVALEERGEAAVELVVVGRFAVLLRAADEAGELTELIIGLPVPGRGGRYDTTPVDLVVAQLTALHGGGGYAGFIAGIGPGEIAFVRSADGFRWTRRDAMRTTGLPAEANPVGLWEAPDGNLLAAFTDPIGTSLTFAASSSGTDWTIGPSFSSSAQLRPGVVAAASTGSLITVEERAEDGSVAATTQHWLPRGSAEPQLLDLDGGERVRLAAGTDAGVLAVVTGPDDLSQPGADHELIWILDGQLLPVDVEGLVEADIRELTNGDGVITVITSLETQQLPPVPLTPLTVTPGSGLPDELTGSAVVRDIVAGPHGAAALVVDGGTEVKVLVTRNYETWTPVSISGSVTDLVIEGVGRDEVILEGFGVGAGPQRIMIPLPN